MFDSVFKGEVPAATIAGETFLNSSKRGPAWFVLTFIILAPLSLRTRARDLHGAAKISLVSVMLALLTEMLCALVHGLSHWNSRKHTFFGNSSSDMVDGLYDIFRAFVGISMLPYVVAEMRWPENGKAVATRACRNISMIYVCISSVCYFGYGDEIKSNQKSPITTLYNLGGLYTLASRFMAILLVVKTLASYPIFFWPMCREIETYFAWRDAPVMLRLPWAIRRWRRLKFALRMGLVALTLIPFLLSKRSIKMLVIFLVFGPIPFMNGVLPSLIAVSAIFRHWQVKRRLAGAPFSGLGEGSHSSSVEARRSSLGEARRSYLTARSRASTDCGRRWSVTVAGAPPVDGYFCGTLSAHCAATIGVASILCFTFVYQLVLLQGRMTKGFLLPVSFTD